MKMKKVMLVLLLAWLCIGLAPIWGATGTKKDEMVFCEYGPYKVGEQFSFKLAAIDPNGQDFEGSGVFWMVESLPAFMAYNAVNCSDGVVLTNNCPPDPNDRTILNPADDACGKIAFTGKASKTDTGIKEFALSAVDGGGNETWVWIRVTIVKRPASDDHHPPSIFGCQ